MSHTLSRIDALPAEKRALLVRQLLQQQQTVESTPGHYDVAIIGGEVTGPTTALQIKKAARPQPQCVRGRAAPGQRSRTSV
jgi:hypothetical protein